MSDFLPQLKPLTLNSLSSEYDMVVNLTWYCLELLFLT